MTSGHAIFDERSLLKVEPLSSDDIRRTQNSQTHLESSEYFHIQRESGISDGTMVDEKILEVQTLGGAQLQKRPFSSVGPIGKHICNDDYSSYALNVAELGVEFDKVKLLKSSKILEKEVEADNIEYVLT